MQWRAGLGGDVAGAHDLPGQAMRPVAGKNARIATLVLLDPATGRETRRWPLAACEDPHPFLGPLVPSAGALRVFFGRGPAEATRDLMLLGP